MGSNPGPPLGCVILDPPAHNSQPSIPQPRLLSRPRNPVNATRPEVLSAWGLCSGGPPARTSWTERWPEPDRRLEPSPRRSRPGPTKPRLTCRPRASGSPRKPPVGQTGFFWKQLADSLSALWSLHPQDGDTAAHAPGLRGNEGTHPSWPGLLWAPRLPCRNRAPRAPDDSVSPHGHDRDVLRTGLA